MHDASNQECDLFSKLRGYPMPRELFPYADDQRIIIAFLRGQFDRLLDDNARITIEQGKLHLDGTVCAWFDTGGALTMKLGGTYPLTLFKIVEFINELLGITPEEGSLSHHRDSADMLQWYVGDRVISVEDPFVVAGPLGIAAYRASL